MSEPKNILNDDEAMRAIRTLCERGYSPDEVIAVLESEVVSPNASRHCSQCGKATKNAHEVNPLDNSEPICVDCYRGWDPPHPEDPSASSLLEDDVEVLGLVNEVGDKPEREESEGAGLFSPAPKTIAMNTKLFTCFECGFPVTMLATGGRTIEYHPGYHVPIPSDIEIPTCSNCGQLYLDEGLTVQLDPILKKEFLQQRASHFHEFGDRR